MMARREGSVKTLTRNAGRHKKGYRTFFVFGISLIYHIEGHRDCSTVSTSRTESDSVVAIVLLPTGPQSSPAALVISIGVGVRAVVLCKDELSNKYIQSEIRYKITH